MKNLVLITSVIDTPNIELSYGIRSRFNKNERLEQTKKTIESVKNYIFNNIIFIVECSKLTNEEEEYFKNNSDYFLNLYDNIDKRNLIYSKSKAICEGTQTISALKYIIDNNINYDSLIKISGRYIITSNFNIYNIINNSIVLKYVDRNENNALTVFFKIPKIFVFEFYNFLKEKITNLINANQIGYYELLFGEYINMTSCNKLILDTIGVEGEVSVCPVYFKG